MDRSSISTHKRNHSHDPKIPRSLQKTPSIKLHHAQNVMYIIHMLYYFLSTVPKSQAITPQQARLSAPRPRPSFKQTFWSSNEAAFPLPDFLKEGNKRSDTNSSGSRKFETHVQTSGLALESRNGRSTVHGRGAAVAGRIIRDSASSSRGRRLASSTRGRRSTSLSWHRRA